MAYFAHIDDDGTVLQVIRVSNADAPDPAPSNSEPLGQAFIASLGLEGDYRQTSYHGSFRKMYAPIGGRYLADADVFIAPQPYPSWTLDADHDWQPPTPMPEEGGPYVWDEENLTWVSVSA
jgi:hypothetical protein